MSKEVNK